MNNLIKILLFLCTLIELNESYYVAIDAHAEECFFERVQAGAKLGLTFEVVEGGFLDIDVRITGPMNQVIHQEDRSSSGKFTFAADTDGVYTYCLSNKMSTMTPKAVMFSLDIDEPSKTSVDGGAQATDSEHNKLEEMIKELSHSLTAVKHEQEYMAVRDKLHRSINESTNSRVVLWAFFEALVIVAMTLGQVYYLKRFFEVRRVI